MVWNKKKVIVVDGVEYLDKDGKLKVFKVKREVIILVGMLRLFFVFEVFGIGNLR